MKPLLHKLFLLLLTLCFLCSCESDSLASRPWIKGYSPRPDNYNPADYTNLYFNSYKGLCITNAEEETFHYDGDYLCNGITYLYYGNMKIYRAHFAIGFGAMTELEVLSSRYYMFEYSLEPGTDVSLYTYYTNTFIGSSPPSALRVTVSATALTKAVLFQSGTVILDGDLSEFEVSYQRPDNTETKLCLTGSGKDHVEVYYENGTLVAEGEELEYYVTEEPIWQALPE